MEQLAALERGDHSALEPSWAAALRFAEEMTPSRGRPSGSTWEALAAHWRESQIVELVSVAALFNYFNRFAEALEIPPTR